MMQMGPNLWCFCGGKCARDGDLLVRFSGGLVAWPGAAWRAEGRKG